MLFLYVLLALSALLGAAFGYLYWRSAGRLPSHAQFLSYLDQGSERYGHVGRLFSAEDFAFLERSAHGSGLRPVLRRERRRLLRVILSQLREEFEALAAIGSMLAVSSTGQSDRFSAVLARQTLRFYATYARLRAYSYWPGTGMENPLPGLLVEQVRGLRQGTHQLISALTPQDLEQLRSSFYSR